MAVKSWQRAVIVASVGAASMSLANAVTAHAASAAPVTAVVQADPAVQKLPPGFRIEGGVLYNSKNTPVKMPPGWTIKDGVIYDPDNVVATIVYKPSTASTTTESASTPTKSDDWCGAPKKGGLDGMIAGIVGDAFCLANHVTKHSLKFAGDSTMAVVGPKGILHFVG